MENNAGCPLNKLLNAPLINYHPKTGRYCFRDLT